MFVDVFCGKNLFKTFVAAFASAIEGPGSSCSSSISEDESTIELFFHLLMPRYLPHSLPQLTRKSLPPLPWLTPGQVSTGGGGEMETAKSLAYRPFVPLMGSAATLTNVQ
ncbi:hypothetical protein AVEN_224767-1 [Araneus ventricosus]|uniref:Uncharacterized protein n=1 Tax=Araneus ventricosus TaxID=182803 RepID=A0A4Y2GT68_ARAVE|nr:hypothetical protein AVEN_224767-1 [Araneus ventricosus]